MNGRRIDAGRTVAVAVGGDVGAGRKKARCWRSGSCSPNADAQFGAATVGHGTRGIGVRIAFRSCSRQAGMNSEGWEQHSGEAVAKRW